MSSNKSALGFEIVLTGQDGDAYLKIYIDVLRYDTLSDGSLVPNRIGRIGFQSHAGRVSQRCEPMPDTEYAPGKGYCAWYQTTIETETRLHNFDSDQALMSKFVKGMTKNFPKVESWLGTGDNVDQVRKFVFAAVESFPQMLQDRKSGDWAKVEKGCLVWPKW